VASILQSAAVKKIVPLLSTRVQRIFICLAAILNLRNALVLFIMAKRHPVINSVYERYQICSFLLSRRRLQNKK
jgi:hypothetical protein